MSPTNTLLNLICAHPYQTIVHAANGAILLEPRIFTVPTLWALGFEQRGPRRGSLAASTMSYFGYVPAGGVYALAQSAAMGGYGAGLAAGAAQAGAVVSSGLTWFMGRNNTGA
ncbi:hypothetical protein COCVIDRAFT_86794 [Bipolaris victoriae FI3]|uniref:Uncharacterized protein n=2 Tax=Bipolaris TaxID=33194 RepID=W6YKS0_COCC2|nr:uncharacterized protein COCCADRAFT_83196 [Bipolaris zeicola 26-R-13]XP_014561321.1 hypothetical protein COCVIDRAFT_86794 [Bipolaris victoriae FI3]EUC38320.1 hypothetical protein COCCADRAFT_83196 [Bipolaris zeicola 26-R-13]